MNICRRCARRETAMRFDALAYADEALADVCDEAFGFASACGSDVVALEHLVFAMTIIDEAAELLERADVDVSRLNAQAHRIATTTTTAGGAGYAREPAPDRDVIEAFDLAVGLARDNGFDDATCEELLLVLRAYRTSDGDLSMLIGSLGGRDADTGAWQAHAREAHVEIRDFSTGVTARAAGACVGNGEDRARDRASHGTSETLERRLVELERQAGHDRQRIVHALHELSRQREMLPAADDWRAQMQALATRVDALSRSLQTSTNPVRGPNSVAMRADVSADLERRLSGIVGQLERQNREIEKLRTEISDAGAAMRIATSGTQRVATKADEGRTLTAPAQLYPRSHSRSRSVRRRTSIAGFRSAGLRFARAHRIGLRRRPARRERSWWAYLGDAVLFGAARRRGGRFHAFRSHRVRVQSPRRQRPATGAPVRIDRQDTAAVAQASEPRFYLGVDDDIVDAPSIGPKTAERLRVARIFTVRDLLAADPDEVASVVTARHITAAAVRDWQDQARLVITVPFLRGTHAQLLVGAGFRSAAAIAASDQASLMAALLRFATTREGQSVLRNGPPPELEKIITWMRNAREAQVHRAA